MRYWVDQLETTVNRLKKDIEEMKVKHLFELNQTHADALMEAAAAVEKGITPDELRQRATLFIDANKI